MEAWQISSNIKYLQYGLLKKKQKKHAISATKMPNMWIQATEKQITGNGMCRWQTWWSPKMEVPTSHPFWLDFSMTETIQLLGHPILGHRLTNSMSLLGNWVIQLITRQKVSRIEHTNTKIEQRALVKENIWWMEQILYQWIGDVSYLFIRVLPSKVMQDFFCSLVVLNLGQAEV